MDRNQLFRRIPKVDLLLEKREIKDLIEAYGYSVVMDAIRSETDRLREMIKEARDPGEAEKEIDGLLDAVGGHVKGLYTPNVRRVINGTGTILHTNLGRAPIMREQAERLADIVAGYSNLEYNLKEGRRGERYSHF